MSIDKHTILKIFRIALVLFLAGQCIEQLFIILSNAETLKLCNWDCNWYKSIAGAGYDPGPHETEHIGAANWAFFPLFPLLAGFVYSVSGISLDLALIITSKLFFFTAVFSFILCAMEWNPGDDPWIAGAVAVFNPYGVYGNAGYAEPLFMTLTCLSLYFLKRNRFVLSGLCGAFLSGTKIMGGSIGFSYLIRAIRCRPKSRNRIDILLGLCLIPAGLAAYMLSLYFHTGDALAFSNVQVAWNHELGNLLTHLLAIFDPTPIAVASGISICVVCLVAFQFVIRKQHELLAFTLVATLLPLSTGLMSMPRYIWWQAPVLLGIAAALNGKRSVLWLYLAISLFCSYIIYSAWFDGDGWVV